MKAFKYVPDVINKPTGSGPGRRQDPSCWITGPCPIRRDKYYAWLKHRSQARYRKEYYDLTWEQFESLWIQEQDWDNRGKQSTNICMSQIDYNLGWTASNVEIITRLEQLRKPKKNKC
jgi:hypothetical protein|tara:strand:- start:268 stop:621 length:354 start_codon:yes stop_codon:yes gene_type:complete